MAPPLRPGTASSLFADHFGRLVVLLRLEPANVPAQKEALRRAITVLRMGTVHLETGIEHSELPDESTLQGRLLSRRVEAIHFDSNAPAAEVLFVARGLADDRLPVIGSAEITVEILPVSAPHSPRYTPAPDGFTSSLPLPELTAETPSGRSRTITGPVDESRRLARAFEVAAAQAYWVEALHAAQALVALASRFPEHERRSYLLSLRRLFNRKMLSELIVYAMRANEEQHRVVEVLAFGGLEALELAVEQVARAETIGPRRFLHDFIAQRPEALPLLLRLLESSHIHAVCHGVDLLGKLGVPDAIEPLRALAGHPDSRVRQAVVLALGRFHQHEVIEPLRKALSDSSPRIRASAAHVLAESNSGALAMPILAALEHEKDPATWKQLVMALGRIDSGHATKALIAVALDKKALLKSGGHSVPQRLAAVEALVAAGHPHAISALERLAVEADGRIRAAAQEGLSSHSG